jgi:uncharacterized protein
MAEAPLMPKATAVWLIDNTSLTFDQIAMFCQMHPLEIAGIADGEVAVGIIGLDPVQNVQLTREELERCQADPKAKLKLAAPAAKLPSAAKRRRGRYTPVSKRQDRPNAIAWLLQRHGELTDGQISKLLGTTKATINAVRDGTHWNSANIKAGDPVQLGLCSHAELDDAVRKARKSGRRPPEAVEGAPAAIVPAPEPVALPESRAADDEITSPAAARRKADQLFG